MSAVPDSPELDDVDPASWHRRVCQVAPWLSVSGDLHPDSDIALAQLEEWTALGITDVLDLREEWSDEELVAAHAPGIRYHWLGTHDEGGAQSAEWYDAGLDVSRAVRAEGGHLLVHCHMGVNRAPSMAYRMLLDGGEPTVGALETIRAARPIAAALYADSALDHHLAETGLEEANAQTERLVLAEHLAAHPVDVAWLISRIRAVE